MNNLDRSLSALKGCQPVESREDGGVAGRALDGPESGSAACSDWGLLPLKGQHLRLRVLLRPAFLIEDHEANVSRSAAHLLPHLPPFLERSGPAASPLALLTSKVDVCKSDLCCDLETNLLEASAAAGWGCPSAIGDSLLGALGDTESWRWAQGTMPDGSPPFLGLGCPPAITALLLPQSIQRRGGNLGALRAPLGKLQPPDCIGEEKGTSKWIKAEGNSGQAGIEGPAFIWPSIGLALLLFLPRPGSLSPADVDPHTHHPTSLGLKSTSQLHCSGRTGCRHNVAGFHLEHPAKDLALRRTAVFRKYRPV